MEHTKTPWTVGKNKDGSISRNGILACISQAGHSGSLATVPIAKRSTVIRNENGSRHSGVEPWPEGEANAEFIVRAANSHDALLEACRQAQFQHQASFCEPHAPDCSCGLCELSATLSAAIATAKPPNT